MNNEREEVQFHSCGHLHCGCIVSDYMEFCSESCARIVAEDSARHGCDCQHGVCVEVEPREAAAPAQPRARQ